MNNTLSAPLFLEKLRTATSQAHTNLEDLPVSKSIMHPEVSNADYALYLSLMHDVVKDAEENIFPVVNKILPNLDVHPKANFLENDLTTLNAVKESHTVKPLSSGLSTFTPAFALGILYVIEGSSLGGRVILKNITAALGHDANNGAKYFAGYGGQTGSHWKNFLSQITAYQETTNTQDEIIAGANFAFIAISRHFSENFSQ